MKLNKLIILTLTCTLFIAGIIMADVPGLTSYQGRLTNADGDIVPNGSYSITFSIFDALSGGNQQWTETHASVNVQNGIFAVLLGSITPLDNTVFNGPERYLEVRFENNVISPRVRFTTVSYSYRIGTIDGSAGGFVKGSIFVSPDESNPEQSGLVISDVNGQRAIDISVDAGNFGSISFYEPVDNKDGSAADVKAVTINESGIVIYDGSGVDTSASFLVDEFGSGSVLLYEPVDTKGNTSKKFEINDAGLIMYRSGSEDTTVSLSEDITGGGLISLYEPVDTKDPFSQGTKKIEMSPSGLFMFGTTITDTSLKVAPNGDIVGLGQITMGENSSSGEETSVLGFNNVADGDSSAIGGGAGNTTTGSSTVIAGGNSNTANGIGSVISGGVLNTTNGDFSFISGGYQNAADGPYSAILGGSLNSTFGDHSLASGYRANADHPGSFVWADRTEEDFITTADNQFIIRASGGVGIGTNSPVGLLDVAGTGGDASVNLPESAVSAQEMSNEPGLASSRQLTDVDLTQKAYAMVDVVTTTITIPTSGYIMVRGGGTFVSTGTDKANQALLQIDEENGGGPMAPYYVQVGIGDQDSPAAINYFSFNTERIYYKPAGTYEFRLEAMPNTINGTGALTRVSKSFLTAMFVPTAYGTVNE